MPWLLRMWLPQFLHPWTSSCLWTTWARAWHTAGGYGCGHGSTSEGSGGEAGCSGWGSRDGGSRWGSTAWGILTYEVTVWRWRGDPGMTTKQRSRAREAHVREGEASGPHTIAWFQGREGSEQGGVCGPRSEQSLGDLHGDRTTGDGGRGWGGAGDAEVWSVCRPWLFEKGWGWSEASGEYIGGWVGEGEPCPALHLASQLHRDIQGRSVSWRGSRHQSRPAGKSFLAGLVSQHSLYYRTHGACPCWGVCD